MSAIALVRIAEPHAQKMWQLVNTQIVWLKLRIEFPNAGLIESVGSLKMRAGGPAMNKMMYATFAMAPLVVLVAACSSTPATNPIETSSVTQPSAASAIAGAPANAAKSNGGTRVVAGQPSRIYTLVSFDKSCRPVKPTILLDKQPAKGTVSFQSGAMTTVQYSASGNCLGKSMPGTVVSYTARAGEQGADSFSISARSKSGEVGTRAFNVRIAQ